MPAKGRKPFQNPPNRTMSGPLELKERPMNKPLSESDLATPKVTTADFWLAQIYVWPDAAPS